MVQKIARMATGGSIMSHYVIKFRVIGKHDQEYTRRKEGKVHEDGTNICSTLRKRGVWRMETGIIE